jgi:hypothetical protein
VRYILNSAVITGAGTYTYRLITPEDARTWLADGPYTSTIGYEETQEALRVLTGVNVHINRVGVMMEPGDEAMEPGDEALVIRLAPSMGGRRIDPRLKGKLTPDEVLASFELGLLSMIPWSRR